MKKIIISLLLFLLLPVISIFAQKQFVIGYYPDWAPSEYNYYAESIDYNNLTHIIHSFAWPNAEGELLMGSSFLYPELIDKAHQSGTKVMLALGGWGPTSEGFAPMASNPATRAKFLDTLVNFVLEHRYDGVDWDWEFPANNDEAKLYTILLKELRERFDQISDTLLISMATNPGSWVGQRMEYENMIQYLDWFGIMGYDMHGGWTDHAGHNSPLYSPQNDYDGSLHEAFLYLNGQRSIPAEKLVMGVPFYGREFNSSGLYQSKPEGDDKTILYKDAISRINAGWDYYFDDVSKVPYLQNSTKTKLVTFDDTLSMQFKSEYIKKNNLAGVMIWALGQDYLEQRTPLLSKLGKEFISDDVIVPGFGDYIIAGYYPAWEQASLPADKIQYHNLTHIIHSFAWPSADGELEMYSGMVYPDLYNRTHEAGKKILLSLGGAGNGEFTEMASNDATREKFLNKVTDFVVEHGYDGIDWDWESQSSSQQGELYLTLVRELREKFDQISDSLLITMAISSGDWYGRHIPYEDLIPYLDWFGMMSYDYHGSWTNHAGHNAPLYAPANEPEGSTDLSVKYLRDGRNIPIDKLVLGIPFYGKEFNSTGLYEPLTNNTVGWVKYSGAISRINSGWDYIFDEVAKVPYLQNSTKTKLVTFEDTTSIEYKINYVKENKMAGVMIWQIAEDLLGADQPLLEKIGNEFRKQDPPTSIERYQQSIPENFVLEQNYPNPFNPTTKIRFSVPKKSVVSLKVYNSLGQEITTLVDTELTQGVYEKTFDADGLSSGIYFYMLRTNGSSETKKMILLK